MSIPRLGFFALGLGMLGWFAGCSDDDDQPTEMPAMAGQAGEADEPAGGGGAAGSPEQTPPGGDTNFPGGAAGQTSVELAGAAGRSEGGAAGLAGAGGEGGAPVPTIVLDTADGSLRGALADAVPATLYFWGGDLPQGASSPAVSNCVDACALTWLPFHAEPFVVAETLAEEDFGELTRADGEPQTTYKGWPLYTYSAEVGPETRSGDGVDQLWHAAEQPFYSLVIQKSPAHPEYGLYLADASGFTIYRLLGDQAGTASVDPVSTCTTAGCRRAWPVVSLASIKAVSSIAGKLDIFIRQDTLQIQMSYEGLPIYYFNNDVLPGDTLGVGKTSWVLAEP